jgi:hypothetical protein
MAHVVAAKSGILLPNETIDLNKWCVVACDQYTSQPEYWKSVAAEVGAAPSTLKLIYPEVYLNEPEEAKAARIASIQAEMKSYLSRGLFVDRSDAVVLVERTTEHGARTRHGLMLAVDLEAYEYTKNSHSLIRPTEETVVDRLPPRIRIRKDAPLEVPHILLLIDDAERTVIEPLVQAKGQLYKVYGTELMQGGGQLSGYAVTGTHKDALLSRIGALASDSVQRAKYGAELKSPLLFAVGDGNHSLATAKAVWETKKQEGRVDHAESDPSRYALVELVNVHDPAIVFEPIHRVLAGLPDASSLLGSLGWLSSFQRMEDPKAMAAAVRAHGNAAPHKFGVVAPGLCGVVTVPSPTSTLAVGSLQPALDQYLKRVGAQAGVSIDYVHGDDVVVALGQREAHCAFFLPAMAKAELFPTVIRMGIVPRKTFSMGEAAEKRFYLESRKIL